MTHTAKRCALLLALVFVCCAPPPPTTPHGEADERLALVDYLGLVFHERYAPAEYKRKSFGWNLDGELDRLRATTISRPTDAAFRRALYEFFHSARDLHTGIAFDDERAVWLGLHVKLVEGAYRVAWIDRTALRAPIEVGDEVITLDGVPFATAIAETKAATQFRSTPELEQAMAERLVFLRAAAEWPVIPTVGTTARLRLRRDGREIDLALPWLDMDASPPASRCPFWGKTKTSYVPALGRMVWQNTPKVFPAHVFDAKDGATYGYLRLYTYEVAPKSQPDGARDIADAIDEFARRGVRGIVIDQTGNGGGSFQYVLHSLRRLFDKAIVPPSYRYLVTDGGFVVGFGGHRAIEEFTARLEAVPNDEEAARFMKSTPLFAETLDYLPPVRASLAETAAFLRFLLAQLPTEKPVLTPPHWEVIEKFTPDETRGPVLRVPIVILTDEIMLSAPELGAAALVDNARAITFGTRSAGAGGNQRWISRDSRCPPGVVRDERFLSECAPPRIADIMKRVGVRGFGYTATIGVRADGRYVENEGIAPNVEYHVTAADLREGFRPMRDRILEALAKPTP